MKEATTLLVSPTTFDRGLSLDRNIKSSQKRGLCIAGNSNRKFFKRALHIYVFGSNK